MASSSAKRATEGHSGSRRGGSRVILKMSVQLPDGQKGTIHVFPGSDPAELAEQFCAKHGLSDAKIRSVVKKHIVDNMRNLPPPKAGAPSGRAAQSTPPAARAGGGGGSAPGAERAERAGAPAAAGAPMADAPSTPPGRRAGAPPEPPSASGSRPRDVLSLAARWRLGGWERLLLLRCVHGFRQAAWEARAERRAAEASASRDAEINELHEANARIARLAFAQAGRSVDEASVELAEVLEPRGGLAERRREQLDRVTARECARKAAEGRAALTRAAWRALVAPLVARQHSGARLEAAGSRREAAIRIERTDSLTAASGEASTQCSLHSKELYELNEEVALANGALKAQKEATAEVKRLLAEREAELAAKRAEVDELTARLIESKLSAAELQGASLTLSKNVKDLERQIRVDAVETHEVPYYEPPRSRAMYGSTSRAGRALGSVKSFPTRRGRASSVD